MEAENNTTGAPAKTPSEEIRDLRSAIMSMDSTSQSAFDEIRAVARLALKSLEHLDEHWSPDDLTKAFNVIWVLAEQAQNNINFLAEEVGCSYADEAGLKRAYAWVNYQDCLKARRKDTA